MSWPEFIDRVYEDLKDGKSFSDFRVPLEDEQSLTRILALGLRKIFASYFDLPLESDALFDIVTYRQGDTTRDKAAYREAKKLRWVFFHDVFYAPDILIRSSVGETTADILPIEVKLITGKSPSQTIATSIGQSLIYATKYPQSIAFIGVRRSAKWGKYKLRIPAEPNEKSFYDKLDAMGVKLVMREVGE
jgi:hypothetical protein